MVDSDPEFSVTGCDPDELNGAESKTNSQDGLSFQLDQSKEVREYLTDLFTGKRDRWLPDNPIEYKISSWSWVLIHTEFDALLQR